MKQQLTWSGIQPQRFGDLPWMIIIYGRFMLDHLIQEHVNTRYNLKEFGWTGYPSFVYVQLYTANTIFGSRMPYHSGVMAVGKEPGPGPSIMLWVLLVEVSTTIDKAQTWSPMATTTQQSTVNAPHSNQLNVSCKGVNFGHLSTHILSFFMQRNILQPKEASADNVDAAN